jgi:hypothetical protein
MSTSYECGVTVYNKFDALKNGIEKISDYLVQNSQDLFKLLMYIQPTDVPLSMPDLTNAQKASMICSDALQMYDSNSTTKKNIIFQINVDEAFWIAEPQLRMEIGNFYAIDSYRGYAEINFQIVIPNKQRLFTNGSNTLADRSVAITLELISKLNGKVILDSGFYTPLFINKGASNGVGRNTGAYRQTQNDGYSGYYLTFSVLL